MTDVSCSNHRAEVSDKIQDVSDINQRCLTESQQYMTAMTEVYGSNDINA